VEGLPLRLVIAITTAPLQHRPCPKTTAPGTARNGAIATSQHQGVLSYDPAPLQTTCSVFGLISACRSDLTKAANVKCCGWPMQTLEHELTGRLSDEKWIDDSKNLAIDQNLVVRSLGA